ncbi:MAG: AMP-binding protein [Bacteroidales bacterium]|nr:AMP-binding protein [Bacteroidales bacterium]
MGMIPEIEFKSPSEINNFQNELLIKQLDYLKNNSPYYQKVFASLSFDVSEVTSIDDLKKLPVTTKKDIQLHNDEFICVPREKIVDYITTSGTLGDPVTFGLTDNDLDRLAYNEAISFAGTGITEKDTIQLTTTIDKRFMAGLAYFLGARKLGAGVIRVGAGIPELQWDSINRFSPTVLIAVPSFILKLVEYAKSHGIDYQKSSIRKAICIGEALRTQNLEYSTLAKRIKEVWNIELFSTYASTEMGAAFTECSVGIGGHHHPELLIVEFLDDKNFPVKENEPGEVTITSLGVEGMPLLRFKTGDICYHYTDKCKCGRRTLRMGPVIGRKKQMIKYKGTTLYPPALYNILDHIEYITSYQVEVTTNDIGTDDICIYIACTKQPEDFEKDIKDHFRAVLRVSPSIILKSFEEIEKRKFPEGVRKPITFIDNRK